MLTDAKARKIRGGSKPLAVGGVSGLYFHPSKSNGAGKFTLRFVSPETGKRRDMGLGTYPSVSIAVARRKALEARELIADGCDPIERRKAKAKHESESSRDISFEIAALRVHEDLSPGFRSKKHSAQWINTLATYAFPKIGKAPVKTLTTQDFAEVLKPIWLAKPETASRVKQRCERVMRWCLANQYSQNNPVSAVDALLPKQKSKRDRVVHFPSVPWRDLPYASKLLFANRTCSVGRQALLFLILTASRSGEVRLASWDEFDLRKSVWTVPASRMKAGVMHRVPLSPDAQRIIEDRLPFRREADWVFSRSGKAAISDMTLTKILRDNCIASDTPGRTATAHGFRSSFRDWASENGFSRDLAERSLAHTTANATEAAYHRTDLLDQRRQMMIEWANHVTAQI
ncbi:tyrosine-type recombinase/integrase [Rhodobacteraceae bacterium R_SAG9]|nr:tyrosine-type recombinase/integrase [Rhodobacteraceae bacterium R_SAG9]